MNDGDYCIGIYLDLKKAFDVCNHEILLKKLKNKGVTGKTVENTRLVKVLFVG